MGSKAGIFTVAAIAMLAVALFSPAAAQKPTTKSPPAPPAPTLPPSPAPAPAPAPRHVDLAHLLSVAGPFHTFLDYLQKTDVIETFQRQVNSTKQGITVFVPKDSAFAALGGRTALANLTQDQLRSLLLYHALPRYYSLAEFSRLSSHGPAATLAGSQYALNLTYDMGTVRVKSAWSSPEISSSVYSTRPVAVYEVSQVLLPMQIFKTDPPLVPAPAPAPDARASDDVAPSPASGKSASAKAKAQERSSSYRVGGARYLALVAVSAGLMLLW